MDFPDGTYRTHLCLGSVGSIYFLSADYTLTQFNSRMADVSFDTTTSLEVRSPDGAFVGQLTPSGGHFMVWTEFWEEQDIRFMHLSIVADPWRALTQQEMQCLERGGERFENVTQDVCQSFVDEGCSLETFHVDTSGGYLAIDIFGERRLEIRHFPGANPELLQHQYLGRIALSCVTGSLDSEINISWRDIALDTSWKFLGEISIDCDMIDVVDAFGECSRTRIVASPGVFHLTICRMVSNLGMRHAIDRFMIILKRVEGVFS
jgi:hypothetical protein